MKLNWDFCKSSFLFFNKVYSICLWALVSLKNAMFWWHGDVKTEFVYSSNKWHLHDIKGTCKMVTNSVAGLFKLVNIACLHSYCGFMEYNRLHIFSNEPQSMLGIITLVCHSNNESLFSTKLLPAEWSFLSLELLVCKSLSCYSVIRPYIEIMQLLTFYVLVKCWFKVS